MFLIHSGTSIIHDGLVFNSTFPIDLDQLQVGTRIGLVRHEDGSVDIVLDGEEKYQAFTDVPEGNTTNLIRDRCREKRNKFATTNKLIIGFESVRSYVYQGRQLGTVVTFQVYNRIYQSSSVIPNALIRSVLGN